MRLSPLQEKVLDAMPGTEQDIVDNVRFKYPRDPRVAGPIASALAAVFEKRAAFRDSNGIWRRLT